MLSNIISLTFCFLLEQKLHHGLKVCFASCHSRSELWGLWTVTKELITEGPCHPGCCVGQCILPKVASAGGISWALRLADLSLSAAPPPVSSLGVHIQ